ncbi:hypothetical protein ARMGADRAFT_1068413 [Armillaria gallica]|uniref:Uncharacterized protein n=1 Tax=Armillaria gallica TaxID=47427 RepID=A0A2H3CTS4_ARMGA|nr:hypothetical protein ARMGADRAFT_1068413 [Armillaria gallica]
MLEIIAQIALDPFLNATIGQEAQDEHDCQCKDERARKAERRRTVPSGESEYDSEADEGVGTSRKAKMDKGEHQESASFPSVPTTHPSDLAKDSDTLEVRKWRHKVEMMFLSNKGNPMEEDMLEMDKVFRTVETCESTSFITSRYVAFVFFFSQANIPFPLLRPYFLTLLRPHLVPLG